MKDVQDLYTENYKTLSRDTEEGQITMLDTLNLYSAVCQLYLNKTGRKKRMCVK